MGASEHRFSAAGLVVGLALCAASGCGGAASTFLDQPPSGNGDNGGDDTSTGSHEASGSSSGGGTRDATMDDEPGPGDDMGADAAGDSGGDDGAASADDGGPDASSMCGPCAPGNRCCTQPGTISFGQCYSVLCGACCF